MTAGPPVAPGTGDAVDALATCGFERRDGRWHIPVAPHCNIAQETVGRYARRAGDSLALVFEEADGALKRWSFAELDRWAVRVASRLTALGVRRGDPVGIHTGQRPETAAAHLALYKLGAIAVTMSQLYGADTITHILQDSQLKIAFTEDGAWPGVRPVGPAEIAALQAGPGPDAFVPVDTRSDEPALLMYTSGSTGRPKGLLHAHRILQAYMPTVRMFYDLSMDDPDAVFWTPAD